MQPSCFKLGISHRGVVARRATFFEGLDREGPPRALLAPPWGARGHFSSASPASPHHHLLFFFHQLTWALLAARTIARGISEGGARAICRRRRSASIRQIWRSTRRGAHRTHARRRCASGLPAVMAQVDPREGVTAQGRLPGRPTPVRDSGTTVRPFRSGTTVSFRSGMRI
eukprot:COSAG03_NODE_849_length_5637_cov_3.297941_2_plen_171_part_00